MNEVWTVERHVDHEFGEVRDVCGSKDEALKVATEIMAEVGTSGSWHFEEEKDGSASWAQGHNTVSIDRYVVGAKDERHTETWLCWKELKTIEGEDKPRLVTPWADPKGHEFSMDWLFSNSAAAEIAKNEYAPNEDWYLVEMTLTVVAHHPPAPETDDG